MFLQVSPTDILTLTSGCCTRTPLPAPPEASVDNHQEPSGAAGVSTSSPRGRRQEDTNGNTDGARFTDGPPVRRFRAPSGGGLGLLPGPPSGSHGAGLRNEIKGSDSGISMTSQDVQDMFDLLQQQLPFDMPKLRRKMVSANSSRSVLGCNGSIWLFAISKHSVNSESD